MNKLIMITIMFSPFALFAQAVAEAESGTMAIPHEALIIALVVAVAKVVSNFTEIKETDSAKIKLLKKCINVAGGAISKKTGK